MGKANVLHLPVHKRKKIESELDKYARVYWYAEMIQDLWLEQCRQFFEEFKETTEGDDPGAIRKLLDKWDDSFTRTRNNGINKMVEETGFPYFEVARIFYCFDFRVKVPPELVDQLVAPE